VSEIKPAAAPEASALIAEATKRAGLLWLSVPGQGRPYPAWHMWRPGTNAADGSAYVVTGPGEQPLPGLGDAGQVMVTVPSKDSGGSLISWTAAVTRVAAGSAEWDAFSGLLAAARLNAVLEPGETSLPDRWARTGAVFRLSPVAPADRQPHLHDRG
jgi:hypothetical protein